MASPAVFYAPDDRSTEQRVKDAFETALSPWTGDRSYMRANPSAVNGLSKLTAASAAVDDALTALGKRDRDGTRAWLTGVRDTYASALQAFESVGRDLSGPAALAMIAAFEAVAEELDAARAGLATSPAELQALAKANATLMLAQAKSRDVNARLNKLLAACALPPIDSNLIDAIATARENASKIVRLATAKQDARALHEALEQGVSVQIARERGGGAPVKLALLVQRLGVCFEDSAASDAFAWRQRRYLETAE
jgi:hypothetical protein